MKLEPCVHTWVLVLKHFLLISINGRLDCQTETTLKNYIDQKNLLVVLHQVCIWKHHQGIAEFCKIPQGNKFLPQVVLVYCHVSQDLTRVKNDSWEKCRIEISINPTVLGSLKYLDRIFSWKHSCLSRNDSI